MRLQPKKIGVTLFIATLMVLFYATLSCGKKDDKDDKSSSDTPDNTGTLVLSSGMNAAVPSTMAVTSPTETMSDETMQAGTIVVQGLHQ